MNIFDRLLFEFWFQNSLLDRHSAFCAYSHCQFSIRGRHHLCYLLAGTTFVTTDIYELCFSYLSISVFNTFRTEPSTPIHTDRLFFKGLSQTLRFAQLFTIAVFDPQSYALLRRMFWYSSKYSNLIFCKSTPRQPFQK